MAECRFPGCGRGAVIRGLCRGHVRQEQRGLELRALLGPSGQLGTAPLATVGLRISADCAGPRCGPPAPGVSRPPRAWCSRRGPR
jgi:hypothetical protein